jgi:hypothetical protein
MLARRLTTILLAMTLPEALDTARIPRVENRTSGRTALTTQPYGGGLFDSRAMSTGNGSYGYAVRGEFHVSRRNAPTSRKPRPCLGLLSRDFATLHI